MLAQIEYQYPFATVYDQELNLYMFFQGSMSNPQFYECSNTKVDVSNSIRVTRHRKIVLEYVAQDTHSLDFDSYTEEQQESMRIDTKEC